MIRSTSMGNGFTTVFSNGQQQAPCDLPQDMGGIESAFRPFELLEAALANCITLITQWYAHRHDIPLQAVTAEVEVDHSDPKHMIFTYDVQFDGPLSDEQRARLYRAAEACPIHQALKGKMTIRAKSR